MCQRYNCSAERKCRIRQKLNLENLAHRKEGGGRSLAVYLLAAKSRAFTTRMYQDLRGFSVKFVAVSSP